MRAACDPLRPAGNTHVGCFDSRVFMALQFLPTIRPQLPTALPPPPLKMYERECSLMRGSYLYFANCEIIYNFFLIIERLIFVDVLSRRKLIKLNISCLPFSPEHKGHGWHRFRKVGSISGAHHDTNPCAEAQAVQYLPWFPVQNSWLSSRRYFFKLFFLVSN